MASRFNQEKDTVHVDGFYRVNVAYRAKSNCPLPAEERTERATHFPGQETIAGGVLEKTKNAKNH